MVCKVCNCKRSQLCQVFGTWPVPVYLRLTKEAQVLFWRAAAAVKKRSELEALLIKKVSDIMIQDAIKRSGGSFLPLSVYAQQGYSAAMLESIKEHSESIFDAELQCETYKLTVRSDFTEDITRKVEEEVATLKAGKGLKAKMQMYKSPAEKKKRTRSSSSNSSSKSDSSSDSDSPKTKAAKVKAETAAEVKAAKQEAAEKAKQAKIAAAVLKVEAVSKAKEAAQQAKVKLEAEKKEKAAAAAEAKKKVAEDLSFTQYMQTGGDYRCTQ